MTQQTITSVSKHHSQQPQQHRQSRYHQGPDDLDLYLGERFADLATLPDGGPERAQVRDAIICACLPVTRRLAGRFANRGEPVDDLIQVATVGLIKAVDGFDAERHTQFLAYATPTIVGELKRHFRDKGWSMHVSRPMQEMYLAINRVLPGMAQELGRSPRVEDIAARLGVTDDEVLQGLECGHAYTARSLSAPVGNGENVTPLSEMLGGVDERLESTADRQALRQLVVRLPERERSLLSMRFFDNLTQSEIAAKMGISQMQVSRLLSRTLHSLKESLLVSE